MTSGGEQRLLDRVFPFHFAVDGAGRIVDAGPRLREIAGDRLDGIDFFSGRFVDAPFRISDLETLRNEDGRISVVSLPVLDGIRLRGEFAVDPDAPDAPVRFLGHPWIGSLQELQSQGLRLEDFPPHSGLSDLLVMLQSRESANADLRRLAADLRERGRRLEEELAARERLEAQLQHAQRMEAMGRLAGGVAHDFNNALTAIGGHASLGRMSNDPADARRHLEAISEAARRASDITARLLGFARRQPIAFEPVDVTRAVDDARALLDSLLGARTPLEVEVAEDLPEVLSDRNRLEQAIVNLAINARDASPDGGVIRVSVRSETAESTEVLRFGERAAGCWIVIEVADQGVGMSDTVVEHAFEPFFTTKELGEGTGLGLAMVWSLVERSGGVIDLQTGPDEGTRFTLHLPAMAAGDAGSPSTEGHGSSASDGLPGDGRRLLLVEDDAEALGTMTQLLESAGFEVEAVSSAEDATEIVDRAAQPFDVLVTDVVLSGTSGDRLADTLKLRQPWLRVVLVTGYDRDQVLEGREGDIVLAKPFSIEELQEAIGAR